MVEQNHPCQSKGISAQTQFMKIIIGFKVRLVNYDSETMGMRYMLNLAYVEDSDSDGLPNSLEIKKDSIRITKILMTEYLT